jgi:hypothetical protein
MSLLSILMLMLILHDHRFSMCLQSSSSQISLQRLRLMLIISFTSSNSVLLIHHEFEEDIRYVLAFLLFYFSMGFFVYSLLLVHVYIQVFGSQMNTSVIHNNSKGLQCSSTTILTGCLLPISSENTFSLRRNI